MALAVRSSTSTTYASRANTVLTSPTGLANDDILIAAIFVGASASAPSVTPPSGFTLIGTATTVTDAGNFNARFSLYWKRAASESGSYTFTHTTASSQGLLLAISGATNSGSPVDVFSSNSGLNSTSTALSVTTTAANDFLLYLAHDWQGSGILTPPSGFTEVFDSLVYGATAPQAAAGASGNKTQTNGNGAANPFAAWLVALKESTGSNKTLPADGGSYALTGAAATPKVSRKNVAAAGSYALSGTAATLRLAKRNVALAGSYSLNGSAANGRRAYNLAAIGGVYGLAGQATTVRRGRIAVAGLGSYSFVGVAVSLRSTRRLQAQVGSYVVNGSPATLTKLSALTLSAGVGSYAVSGASAILVRKRLIGATTGSYSLFGMPATLTKFGISPKLNALSGSYAFSGQAATVRSTRRMSGGNGQYSLAGQSATVRRGRALTLTSAHYALAGQSSAIVRHYQIRTASDGYLLSGIDISYRLGRLKPRPGAMMI